MRWLARLTRIVAWVIAGVALVLGVAALVTARRGDGALYPAGSAAPRVEILVVSHGYHAGIALPRAALAEAAQQGGLSALIGLDQRFAGFQWLEVGWGDEGFYTSVPTIASLTLTMGLRALFKPGNPSVLHIVGLPAHPRAVFPAAEMVRLELSATGFDRLARTINDTFAGTGDSPIDEIGPGLYGPSLFFRAHGNFHLFHVCNHWVADVLDAAGVPTTPVVATVTQGLLWDLRWRAGATPLRASGR